MKKEIFEIGELIAKYLAGELSEEEENLLKDWLDSSRLNKKFFDEIVNPEFQIKKINRLKTIDIDSAWEKLNQKNTRKGNRRIWIRFSKIAAAVLIPVFMFLAYYNFKDTTTTTPINDISQGISSGISKAILQLADGRIVELENNSHHILEENGSIISIHDNILIYDEAEELTDEISYNELIIPRGGEFTLNLPDGSKVYLNADSKLRYPVRFDKSIREVELTGEGYFEIARNSDAPFIVKTNHVAVQVLGTEFNLSAYPDEQFTNATLVNGKVQILAETGETITLNPGESSKFNKENGNLSVEKVDISYATAWKNGQIRFRDIPLEDIMRNISRWYDFKVVFIDEEVKTIPFSCSFSRHETVKPLLDIFETTGSIRAEIRDRIIYVSKS